MDESYLECIGCGHREDLLDERKFICPVCGDLYDVKHNFEEIGQNLAYYMDLFEHRAQFSNVSTDDPRISSGVWRYKEWIMPFMPQDQIVSLGEGNVPIVRAGKHLREWIGGGIDLRIILEGMTPTGSFKDFGGTVLMSVAKAAGIKSVCCASTGDTSAMAAAYAAAAGIQCAVILPEGKVTAVQMAQPLAHGAKIILLPGNFDDCMRVMQELVADHGVYPANSLNPARIEGHQATVFRLAQYFGWDLPDWISVPVGNGSNASSIGKAMRLMQQFGFPKVSKILGCQSQAANPLARSWLKARDTGDFSLTAWRSSYKPIAVGETVATAARIGNPVSWEKVTREIDYSGGAMQTAAEEDLIQAVVECGRDGYFVCPQTGTALAGVRNAVREGLIASKERVVVVSTATGLKFTDAIARSAQEKIVTSRDCETASVAKILGL